MPIPLLDEHGLLPAGVHDCALDEIKARFGSFQGNSRRPDLFSRLESYLSEAKASRIVVSVVVDGSFVTDLLVARAGSAESAHWTEFFQQVRLEPGRQKGILRVQL